MSAVDIIVLLFSCSRHRAIERRAGDCGTTCHEGPAEANVDTKPRTLKLSISITHTLKLLLMVVAIDRILYLPPLA